MLRASPDNVRRHLKQRIDRACATNELRRFTPHALRRFTVDELARAGVDIGTACAITGHSLAVMLKHYRQVSRDDKRRALAAARLGAFDDKKVIPFPGGE